MATAAWSQLRAPPLYSGATDTPFGLPVHGCHVPDPWLTGSAPSLGDTRATDKILALAGTRDALASGPLFLLSVCSSSGCVRCCCCFFSLLRVLVWVCFLLRAGRSWGMAGIGGRVQVLLVPL
jgi:hypothetical protein